MTDPHHDLDEQLRALPRLDVDEATAERIRLRARAELARATRVPRAVRRAYRGAEIAVVALLGVAHLLWAVLATLLPFR